MRSSHRPIHSFEGLLVVLKMFPESILSWPQPWKCLDPRSFSSRVLLLLVAGTTTIGCDQAPVASVQSSAKVEAPKVIAPAAVTKPVSDAEIHRPTKLPDRIVLTWSGDPSRSQSVTWRTDSSIKVGLAEIAIAGDDSTFAKRARQVKARTETLSSGSVLSHYHSAEFKALSPRTKYAYRVGDGANWSEWFHFSTVSDQPEPFSFVYFGDAQNDLKSMWSRVIREAFTDAPNALFLLHAGDLINTANNDAHWGEWFQAGGWLNGMIPSVPTPGNHEYSKISIETSPPDATLPINLSLTPSLTPHWRPQFTLPEHGPAGLEETTYYLDIQGVRIVSLNSNEKQAEQAKWLDRVLAENPGRWSILTFHHPIYSSAKSRDNVKLRQAWQPIIDKHKVDLVLQGHDHTYARSGLTTGDSIDAEKNESRGVAAKGKGGTIYVVSVSGPKMYDLGTPLRKEFRRVAEDVQLFQIISIDGDELHYVARTATGQPYDGFTLRKRPNQPNELIEEIPNTPQRTRAIKPKTPVKTTEASTK